MIIAEQTRAQALIFGLLLLAGWTFMAAAPVPLEATPAPAATATQDSEAKVGAARLATVFIRRARSIAQSPQPTVGSFDLALRLAHQAVELDPENTEVLRVALSIAEVTEDQAFREDLLSRLARLDPEDQVIRLGRLRMAMERFQTAEERISSYEKLLAEDNIDRIGRPEASRLALDLALLHRRQGNTQKFAEWLGRATAIDQANKEAAGMAAGFFRMQVADPFAEAEMLINLVMADPTDLVSHAALARHLLDHGAYAGATRIYALAAEAQSSIDRLTAHGMAADYAIALWGAGRRDDAEQVLSERQRFIDEQARLAARQERPDMTATEQRTMVRAALPVTMNTVQLAILDRKGDTQTAVDRLSMLMQSLKLSYDALLEREASATSEAEKPSVESKVENLLQRALHLLWFGTEADVSAARGFVAQANDLKALNERAIARFEGLALLREGKPDEALAALEPVMADDLPARMGAAMAYQALGRNRDAATAFLDVTRGAPGTVVGVWAKDRLEALLGRALPRNDLVRRLNTLIEQLPAHIERFTTDAASVIALRIEPVKEAFKPYEPILIRIELTNRANYPIEIGTETALQSRLVLEPTVTMVGQPAIDQTKPIIVSLARRLRLNPRERMSFEFDLRQQPLSDLFDQFVIVGASLALKGTTNFYVTESATVQPGVGGVVNRSPLVRIDGVRISADWVQKALEEVEQSGANPNLTTIGVLCRTLWIRRGRETPESTELYDRTRRTTIEAFGRLSPVGQAWLLSTMPAEEPALESIRQVARTIDHKLVRLSYLMHHVNSSTDPMLDAAARSNDEDVQTIGAYIRDMLAEQERRQNEVN